MASRPGHCPLAIVWFTTTSGMGVDTKLVSTIDGATGETLKVPWIQQVADNEVDMVAGQIVASTSSGAVTVYDIHSGKTLFSVSAQRRDELGANVEALAGGLLYLDTTSGLVVVDVKSGKVTDKNAPRYPKATLDGGYVWWSDNTISAP